MRVRNPPLALSPAGVMDSMAVFETVGRGSTPRRGTYGIRNMEQQTRLQSVADSHATLRRSRTRFDSW